MEVVVCDPIKYGRSDEFHLHGLGDLHKGTKHCREELFRAKVKQVKEDPKARWIGMGDLGEYITPKDPRWDGGHIADWLNVRDIAQCMEDEIEKELRPIKSQCLGLLKGNHELEYELHNNNQVHQHLCDRLGAANLGYACFLDLVFHRGLNSDHRRFRCVATHGAGGAITDGAKVTRLERWMNSFDARIFLHGHTHAIITATVPVLAVAENGRIISKDKVGAMTGSWFSTYTQGIPASYGERKNYPPSGIGSPVFTIIPDKDIVTVQG